MTPPVHDTPIPLAISLHNSPERTSPEQLPSEASCAGWQLEHLQKDADNLIANRPRHTGHFLETHLQSTGVDAQSPGYFGESSTFDFMTKVCSPSGGPADGPAPGISNRSFAPNVASLSVLSESATLFGNSILGVDGDDLFSLPSRPAADRLVDAYFKFTHPMNAYLHEKSFYQRYVHLWLSEEHGGEEADESNLAWFGLVNLVFAFGSRHMQIAGRTPTGDMRYFKRARTLVSCSLFQKGSIELVQALLLMGQYLHASLELDNSWTIIGLAIRMAQGLGLHLDVSKSTLTIIDQEIRKRVWWGCFVIDRILSMKLGRPPTINDSQDITVGLPLPVDDEYITDGSGELPSQPAGIPSKLAFVNYVIHQCRLLERICKTLYSGDLVNVSGQGQLDISELLALTIQLDGKLTSWLQTLPPHLQFDSQVPGWHFERQRHQLYMRCGYCLYCPSSYTNLS